MLSVDDQFGDCANRLPGTAINAARTWEAARKTSERCRETTSTSVIQRKCRLDGAFDAEGNSPFSGLYHFGIISPRRYDSTSYESFDDARL